MRLRVVFLGCFLTLAPICLGGSRAWSQVSAGAAVDRGASAPGAANSDKLLEKVRQLARRQDYRAAEQLLVEHLRDVQARRPRDPAFGLLVVELGTVYVQSGQYDEAAGWLSRLLPQLEGIQHPSRKLLEQESLVAELLAEAHAKLGQSEQGIAILRRTIARYDQEDVVDPAGKMDLLAHVAALEKSPQPESEMDALADRLKTDFQRRALPLKDYARGLRSLARYQRLTGQFERAVATLKSLLRADESKKDHREEPAIWMQVADNYRSAGNSAAEVEALRTALRVEQASRDAGAATPPSVEQRSLFDEAEIERQLAVALPRAGHGRDAGKQLDEARRHYRDALQLASQPTPKDAEPVGVAPIILLERLANVSGDALQLPGAADSGAAQEAISAHRELLAEYDRTLLANDPRFAQLRVTLGSFYISAGEFESARSELLKAQSYWLGRHPANYLMLARTLNLLGETALASDSNPLAKAGDYFGQAAKICDAHLSDDELRWWVRLNQGRLATMAGHFQQAFDTFGEIPEMGPASPVSRKLYSSLLLHRGLLHKESLQFDEASRYCQQALEMRRADLGEDDVELLPYYLALGGLHIARHDAESLQRVVDVATKIGSRLKPNHPDRLATRHQEAMAHYLRGELTADAKQRNQARQLWQKLLADCQGPSQGALRARLLHFLARVDYLDWAAAVKARNERMASLNRGDFRGNEAQFERWEQRTSAFNKQLAQHQEARPKYLKKLEEYDLRAGDEFPVRQRAYQDLVQMRDALEKEKTELIARSETLDREKDQLLKAAAELAGAGTLLKDAEKLAQQAIALLSDGEYPSLHYAALCNYAQILRAQSGAFDAGDKHLARAIDVLEKAIEIVESPRSKTVGGDLARADFFAQYQNAFDLLVQYNFQAGRFIEALIAAEQARSRTLLDQLRAADAPLPSQRKDIAAVVGRWRDSKEPLLYYYVGGATSYLFMLGDKHGTLEAVGLKVALDATSGPSSQDASAAAIADVVAELRSSISDPRNAQSLRDDSLVRKRLAVGSAVLLPSAARDFLRNEKALGVSHVTVVPHGAISQLPLEALILDEGSESLYLVDVCPPLAYAPSLAVLEDLSRRKPGVSRMPSVLSVGNPAYKAAAKSPIDLASFESADNVAPASATTRRPSEPLDLLLNSQEECRRIDEAFKARFGVASARMLTEHQATEGEVRQALEERSFTIVHLAAHGKIGDAREGFFPEILLAPPAKPSNSHGDDGILELSEIYKLPLAGCELAILSACNTARSKASKDAARGEPSFSLASAFLTSGARRVLATQWQVADKSTSEMVASFVEKLTGELAGDDAVDYARLLAEARKQLRANPQWDTPFHWAPFILIGPAGGTAGAAE